MKETRPTFAELEILQILWKYQPASVRSINEKLENRVGYTTTLKMLQRMTEKRLVIRESQGKAHLYSAALEETAIQRSFFNGLLNKVFGGSSEKLMMHALGHEGVSGEELDELREWVESKKKDD